MTTSLAKDGEPHHGLNDSSFDSFIDSNLILEASSPAPTAVTPATPAKTDRSISRPKVAPLPALPSHLSEAGHQAGPASPQVTDFLNYPHSSSSTVTTPTTSNSSSLHNLNFDFCDPHGNGSHANENPLFATAVPDERQVTGLAAVSAPFGDADMQGGGVAHDVIAAPHRDFSWDDNNPFYPMQMAHSFSRSSDDLDARSAGQQQGASAGHHHHHQRSLSLRDVAPPSALDDFSRTGTLASLPFPTVKMEPMSSSFTTGISDNVPSPTTEDRSSPTSSAVSSSLFDHGSPRMDKKRRLDSPSESMGSSQSNKSSKCSSTTSAATKSSSTSKKTSGASRRSRSGTVSGKNGCASDITTTASITPNLSFSPASLIENAAAPAVLTAPSQATLMVTDSAAVSKDPALGVSPNEEHSGPQHGLPQKTALQTNDPDHTSQPSDEAPSAAPPKAGNKRPPPSASQVTESGQPFPVIDTSAKHSSLFVPPDTSGLTKREARLVKNRAAAFLSRQRKREQFEELEIKCKNLCRLVWRFWEIVAGPNHDIAFVEKYRQSGLLPAALQEEVDGVKEVLEMVVALKGGSVAPTEDGQLQGAVAAGINSANGKIIADAAASSHSPPTIVAAKTLTNAAASAGAPAETSSQGQDEIARLRAQLEESRKRESELQAELAQERNLRMEQGYEAGGARKPFRGGKEHQALSLTITPKFEGDEEDVHNMTLDTTTESNRRKGRGRPNLPSGPLRTSERQQRQQSQLSLTSANGAASNGGQRKAAGAALMLVLFSFALFGLPGGQMSRIGSIAHPTSTDDFSVGKVLGTSLSSAAPYGQDEEEDLVDYDSADKQPPSSHLSAKDLLPPMPDMLDMLNLDDVTDGEEVLSSQSKGTQQDLSRSFRDVLDCRHGDQTVVDYQAFAKDLGASLDWDVQRGFIVLGSDHDHDDEEVTDIKGKQRKSFSLGEKAKLKEDLSGEVAPTKLTLFVPASEVKGDGMDAEDEFYDAPLASVEASATASGSAISPASGQSSTNTESESKDLTQAEATRAALRVLRNHRIAQEAAALATSRRLGQKPSPSVRIGSPRLTYPGKQDKEQRTDDKNKVTVDEEGEKERPANVRDTNLHIDGEEEQDFSKDVMDASSATDKIRGTDFYQLEFSLSGAKVRNIAELAKLLGVIRNKKE